MMLFGNAREIKRPPRRSWERKMASVPRFGCEKVRPIWNGLPSASVRHAIRGGEAEKKACEARRVKR